VPPNLPTAVRAAETMTMSDMFKLLGRVRVSVHAGTRLQARSLT
jgi:hypothetical protein